MSIPLPRSNTPTLMSVCTPKLFSGFQTPSSAYKTPRTGSNKLGMTPRSGSDSENRTCFISFIENISNREVGAAVLRIYPPILTLYQYTDTALYTHSRHLIEVHTPTKVLVPGNVTTSKSPLSQMIKENSKKISDNKWSNLINDEDEMFSCSYTVCEVARARFSDTIGLSLLSELSNNNIIENIIDNTDDQLVNRYLCISAAAACIFFSQTEYKINIIPHTLKIHFQTLEGQLMIDPISLRQFSILSTPISSSCSSFSTCSSSIAPSRSSKTKSKNEQQMFRLYTDKRNLCSPTLFNLLDRCLTPSGTRFLRTTLAAPPTQINIIQERQEFIAELASSSSDSSDLYYDLLDIFSNIADLDTVITFLVTKGTAKNYGCSNAIDSLQRLLCDVEKVQIMQEIFSRMKSSLAQKMANNIKNSEFQKINNIISDFLERDPGVHNSSDSSRTATTSSTVQNDATRQIYALKSGVLGILDITRKSYEESLSDIFSHSKILSDKYNLKIKVKYNKSRRFYLQINKSHLEKNANGTKNSGKASSKNKNAVLSSVVDIVDKMNVSPSGYLIPPEMIHVVENANYVIGTTYDLLLLNKKNLSAQEDSIALTQKFVEGKIEEIRPFIGDIYKVSEVISFIDYLLSLATVARESKDYSMPKITNNQLFALRKARHPIMEKLISSDFAQKVSNLLSTNAPMKEADTKDKLIPTFVPNDLDLTTARPMMLLKGVNMSGKTTYLQMAIQISIMAQCGSFVPCEKCVLCPFTSIFTRSGTNDSIEGNASAFLVEMKEMNHIISLADSTSFIAIDEPCISTSVRDGIGLSFACLEKLISSHSFVLCSTHFNELETLLDIYSCVSLKEMRAREIEVPKTLAQKQILATRNNGNLRNDNFAKKFVYLYTVGDALGQKNTSSGYGITIAEDFYPPELICEARDCYEKLKQQEVGEKSTKNTGKMASFSILQQLLALKVSSLNDEELRSSILSLQRRCHQPTKQAKS